MKGSSPWFTPLSWPYSAAVWLRNTLYNKGHLKSYAPFGKTIVLGNLALGGTGKTPHADYLLSLLSNHKVCLLSRGYGRKSSGYRDVRPDSHPEEVGDEPLLLSQKHPDIPVAVCEDRLEGLRRLTAKHPEMAVTVLDDAFQHRQLRGGLNILLTTWQQPFTRDALLPAGKLRDHPMRARQAHAIIVSKTPPDADAQQRQALLNELNYLGVPVFFSGLAYTAPDLLSKKNEKSAADQSKSLADFSQVVLLSAIADPSLFEAEAKRNYPVMKHFVFRDHHHFNATDLQRIRNFIGRFAAGSVALLTTEKDAMRLIPLLGKSEGISCPIYGLGLKVDFGSDAEEFNKLIYNYVES